MKTKYHLRIIYVLLGLIAIVGCFFILYNANWLIGDDAIIIRHTGMGHAFSCSDTTFPEIGRFFPFTYLMYNILYFFSPGIWLSPTAHYMLNALCFLIFVIFVYLLTRQETKLSNSPWVLWIAFFALIVVVERTYVSFIHSFSTTWFGLTLSSIFLLCFYLFYKKNNNWWYGVIALLIMNYKVYMGEAGFIGPLTLGTTALLFGWKQLSRSEKVFNFALIGVAIVFLINYYFVSYRHATEFYDASHGTGVSFINNAIAMLLSQKTLIIIFGLFFWRLYRVFLKKEAFQPLYDSLLACVVVGTCGSFYLRLNWNLYYAGAVLTALPALIHYTVQYLNNKVAFVIWLFLCLFFVKSTTKNIATNQNNRKKDVEIVSDFVQLYKDGNILSWYDVPNNNVDFVNNSWLKESTRTYMGYLLKEEYFKFASITEADIIICPVRVRDNNLSEFSAFQHFETIGEFELYHK